MPKTTKKAAPKKTAAEVLAPTPAAPKDSVLKEAMAIIQGQRREDYGDARESFNAIAEGWSVVVGVPITAVQVSLCMDWLKTCRFVASGTRDSLVDKGGYTGLTALLAGIDD